MRDRETKRDAQERGNPEEAMTTGTLARLEDLDDYQVAEGYPDPRGWTVRTRDGVEVGEVKNLLVDRTAMCVRFLEVELEDGLVPEGRRDHVTGGDSNDRLAHVPIERARLDDDRDSVALDLDAVALASIGVTDLQSAVAPATDMPGEHARFFGRRAPEGEAPYLVLHEERLAVGKRSVPAGEVVVRKTVETENVSERVPVRHEEVTIERRAVTPERAGEVGSEVQITEDEIRVPVMREQIVTEKRIVPTEEVVLRKNTVTEEQTVDENLRRERAEVDDEGRTTDRRPDAPNR